MKVWFLANIFVFIDEKDSITKMGVIGSHGCLFLNGPSFDGPNRGYLKKYTKIFDPNSRKVSSPYCLSSFAMRDAQKVWVNLTILVNTELFC